VNKAFFFGGCDSGWWMDFKEGVELGVWEAVVAFGGFVGEASGCSVLLGWRSVRLQLWLGVEREWSFCSCFGRVVCGRDFLSGLC
jgi:hypothetical protein